jgi:hypothetical protein
MESMIDQDRRIPRAHDQAMKLHCATVNDCIDVTSAIMSSPRVANGLRLIFEIEDNHRAIGDTEGPDPTPLKADIG